MFFTTERLTTNRFFPVGSAPWAVQAVAALKFTIDDIRSQTAEEVDDGRIASACVAAKYPECLVLDISLQSIAYAFATTHPELAAAAHIQVQKSKAYVAAAKATSNVTSASLTDTVIDIL
jgi:hypothetical protein